MLEAEICISCVTSAINSVFALFFYMPYDKSFADQPCLPPPPSPGEYSWKSFFVSVHKTSKIM